MTKMFITIHCFIILAMAWVSSTVRYFLSKKPLPSKYPVLIDKDTFGTCTYQTVSRGLSYSSPFRLGGLLIST